MLPREVELVSARIGLPGSEEINAFSSPTDWRLHYIKTTVTFTVCSEPATVFYFWLVYGNDNTQITPAEAKPPSDDAMVASFKTALNLRIELFTGDQTHTQQSSFGVFFNGKIFSEDQDKMKQKLESWWKANSAYTSASIEIGTTEVFYKATG